MRFGNFGASTTQSGFTSIAQHVAEMSDPSTD
jgi:hypothetical protein